jgi:hypothetical protein
MYSVKTELSGFQTVERADVRVDVNSTVTSPLTVVGVATEVTVSVPAPVVDVTSTQSRTLER